MKDNYAEVIFCTRQPFSRRKFKDRRLFLEQESLYHIPERRVNMINRRMLSDRRGLFSESMDIFWKEAY
jgi:hypothetical protein